MVKIINKNKKGQSLSTDILVVVIIVLFGALFLVMNKINSEQEGPSFEEKYQLASQDAKTIVSNLKTNEIIDSENVINVERLMTLNQDELRNELGIKNDFCIVFEKDGNLVKIDPENNVNGIGSKEIIVNGVPCK